MGDARSICFRRGDMLKTYRIKAYEGKGYEILRDQIHLAALDLDTPLGMQHASAELIALRARLIEVAGTRERDQPSFRLVICERETGDRVLDWVR